MTFVRIYKLSAFFLAAVPASLPAFEQGTYYIYKLSENGGDAEGENRLVLDSELLENPGDSAVTRKAPQNEPPERSEFEIDYDNLSNIGNASGNEASSFDNYTGISSEEESGSTESEFDFGTSDSSSVFRQE